MYSHGAKLHKQAILKIWSGFSELSGSHILKDDPEEMAIAAAIWTAHGAGECKSPWQCTLNKGH